VRQGAVHCTGWMRWLLFGACVGALRILHMLLFVMRMFIWCC
jgi:hypothetical protein